MPANRNEALRVLLVHGPSAAWERLAGGLTREGLRVATAHTGEDALRRFRADAPDAVVLDGDGRLPGERLREGALDALALCRAIRARTGPRGTSILVLGSRADDLHAIPAYQAGADAYGSLPFAPAVLALRLRALVGAATATTSAASGAVLGHSLEAERAERAVWVGGWQLDPETHEARRRVSPNAAASGTTVALTRAEFRLLYLLSANAGRTVPTERLREYAGIARVRSHVSRLRRRFGLPAAGPGAIEAHAGVGYRYVPCPPPA